MSLLDDVSIVVTPNGYKAGELYAVLPVPTEGADVIVNGDFSSATGWSEVGDFTIIGGKASITNASQYSQLTSQIGVSFLSAGKQYKLQVDVETLSISGVFAYRVTGGAITPIYSTDLVGGVYTTYFTMPSDGYLWFQTTGSYTGLNVTIDNVSVKEYTAADMDVTRATAATRVDEAGLVNYAEIVGSEEVTNNEFATVSDWSTNTGWSISGGVATCDGTQTGNSYLTSTSPDAVIGVTYSVIVVVDSVSTGWLTTKVGGANSNDYISTAGTYTYDMTATSVSDIIRIQGNVDFTGIVSSVSVKEVTRDNVPRIDYSGGGCPHILAEPESTNHCTFSEQPSVWTSSTGVTVTANATTSPEGTANASTVVNTATNAFVRNAFLYTSTDASLNVTTSFFLKYTNNQWVSLKPNFFTGGSNSKTWFDIQNGVLGTNDNVSSSIVDFGNGWYRCSVTHQIAPATDTSGFVFIYAVDNDNSTTQVIGQGFAAFGSQGEQLSYSTSYIPTSGSTVTRVQDIFTRDGISSLINSEEGVLFLEMAALSNDSVQKFISLGDGTTTNRLILGFDNSSNRVISFARVGGGLSFDIKVVLSDVQNYNKLAIKWKENDFALWGNGVELGVDASGASFTSGVLSDLRFSDADGTTEIFNGKVKQLQVYKTALTDTQLAALTS